jgi:uncharacterized repeat protein (TIGR03803 family)
LVADSDGDLYGTTSSGGAYNNGTVYELVRPVPPKTGWAETILHSFTGGADGGQPVAGLVFDSVGNLYGITTFGGLPACSYVIPGCGVVFELSPPTIAGNPWSESILHSFTAPGSGDGSLPEGELIWDGAGNLYGVTPQGGDTAGTPGCYSVGCGTVFQLSHPATPGAVWTETILHSFVYAQGAFPSNAPAFDSQGNLYGTALEGELDTGVVYRLLRPATAGGTWTYKVLYTFGPYLGSDGRNPVGSLSLHGKRVLYGTTIYGGQYCCGTVFQLVPPTVADGPWTENIIYSFSDNGDGSEPQSKLIFDSGGNIYGTTSNSVFELTPPASDGPWTETTLYVFDFYKTGYYAAGLLRGKNGVLFGTAQAGKPGTKGLVFGVLP